MSLAWLYLLAAGLCEIGWPVGFKLSQRPGLEWGGLCAAVGSMGLSGWLLWLAQREIPLGTAYAVWTGIGGAGTFLIGVAFFGDALTLARAMGVLLIVGGVVTLKLSH